MELYKGIITRRSQRNYTGAFIPDNEIEKIIKAGMFAPSARNKRPWHFIVIDDRSIMQQIMNVHPYSLMLKNASHAILICGDEKLQNGPGYYKLDCSAATENILLASHALGYGAVWLGIEPKTDRINAMRNIFSLPDYINPLSLVSIGIPLEKNIRIPDRFEPEKIRRNKW
jgi:nitroreductase